jgi:aldose 1-epimerase
VNRQPPHVAAPSAGVTLSAGAVSAHIAGGDLLSASSLTYEDRELLVDPDDLPAGYRVHGKRAGITLLHPWANRLSADDYDFDGRHGHLDAAGERVTRDAHGLAIHGLTAPTPWHLLPDGPSRAAASLTWLGEPGFPYAHQIVVRFALAAGADGAVALTITTELTALDGDCVPVAFGWHPYFRRDPAATIELPNLSELGSDAHGLPDGREIPQQHARIQLGNASLDYGVSGLSPGAQMLLHNPSQTIAVEFASGYSFGQVFAPDDAPVVSLEPMTAPTDALRRGRDLPVAQSEAPYVASFAVAITAPVEQTPTLPRSGG